MQNNFLNRAYLGGKWVDFKDAKVSIATQALHYGTAAFGGMRAQVRDVDGKREVLLFRIDEHALRLSRSAVMLGCEKTKFPASFIKEKILEFVEQNKDVAKDFYIRPLIYTSQLGLTPTLEAEKDFLLYGLELGDYLATDGVSVCISSYRRQEDTMIPGRGKISGSYYISAGAKAEAHARGFDDAIMLTQSGKVSEGSAMNIFMVRDGVLITPPVTECILEGITRKSVIQLAKSMNIEVVERQIDLSEILYCADEVFFTGTAAKITPCKKVENITLNSDRPICQKLQKALSDVFEGKNSEFASWVTRL
jgi:branched-chain amino acid aminotransferase